MDVGVASTSSSEDITMEAANAVVDTKRQSLSGHVFVLTQFDFHVPIGPFCKTNHQLSIVLFSHANPPLQNRKGGFLVDLHRKVQTVPVQKCTISRKRGDDI